MVQGPSLNFSSTIFNFTIPFNNKFPLIIMRRLHEFFCKTPPFSNNSSSGRADYAVQLNSAHAQTLLSSVWALCLTLVPSVFVLFDQRSGTNDTTLERPDLKSENTGPPVELRMPTFTAIFG